MRLARANVPGFSRNLAPRTSTPSSAWLGWCSLLAVGAVSEIDGEDSLEFFEDAVEAQPAPTAFGRVSRNWVMKTPQGQYSRVVDTLGFPWGEGLVPPLCVVQRASRCNG
jgi:hypothetical protein